MKAIIFSRHALEQMPDRGAGKEEVEAAIRSGECVLAKGKRFAFRKNFPFDKQWKGIHYEVKQVMPIVVEEDKEIVVITVYVFYFGAGK